MHEVNFLTATEMNLSMAMLPQYYLKLAETIMDLDTVVGFLLIDLAKLTYSITATHSTHKAQTGKEQLFFKS